MIPDRQPGLHAAVSDRFVAKGNHAGLPPASPKFDTSCGFLAIMLGRSLIY